jgi:hypothetical protein
VIAWDNHTPTTSTTGWTTNYDSNSCGTTYFTVFPSEARVSAELAELNRAQERAEKLAARREGFRDFLGQQFGRPPGPGRPSPKHATCSRRRFHRRTKP